VTSQTLLPLQPRALISIIFPERESEDLCEVIWGT